MRRKKEAQLRQYVFFQLRVHLKSGSDLVAMDKNGLSIIFFYLCLFFFIAFHDNSIFIPFHFFVGLSDPYVKFKMAGRLLHKSRTIHRDLNPVWDEVFVVPIEDPFEPVVVKVSP